MWHRMITWLTAIALVAVAVGAARAQDDNQGDNNYNQNAPVRDYSQRAAIDRYLDAQVWTDQSNGDYYDGDHIRINFRVNRDAFVAIYSVDTRGRVDLIFPNGPNDDNFVVGDQTYTLPRGGDEYDLEVSGPSGTEYLQIVASRERFPIPNWYRGSSIGRGDEDAAQFIDDLNNTYFVRYDGQRFAYDRAVINVREWEPDYFRPIYSPYYPSWAVCGNVYIDYPWGGAVYVDGIYWGCAPLFIPRVLVGWNTFTIYDRYGYCWEQDVHVSRYHTVVLDRTIVQPRATIASKYKEVRMAGYVDPVTHGYPQYRQTIENIGGTRGGAVSIDQFNKPVRGKTLVGMPNENTPDVALPKKYARGVTKLVETNRGLETTGGPIDSRTDQNFTRKSVRSAFDGTVTNRGSEGASVQNGEQGVVNRRTVRGGTDYSAPERANVGGRKTTQQPATGPSDYYQRKDGQSTEKRGSATTVEKSQPPRESGNSRVVERAPAQPRGGSSGKVEGGSKSSGGGQKSAPAPRSGGGGGGKHGR